MSSIEAEPEEAPQALSPWLWYVYLFFQPRRFFETFVKKPNQGLVLGCALSLGMAHAIDRLKTRLGEAEVQDWNDYWLIVLFAGLLGGVFFLFVGAWWYRIRISLAGGNAKPKIARRVYLFSAQIWALPLIAVALIKPLFFESPHAAVASGSVGSSLLGIFVFWSFVTSWIGVRTTFRVHAVKAFVWFLGLPSLLAIGLLALAVWAGQQEVPLLSRPKTYIGEEMRFDYPFNWWVEVEESGEGYELVYVEGVLDSYLRLMAYESDLAAEAELASSIEALGEIGQWSAGEGFQRWGSFSGLGTTGTLKIEGTPCAARLFVTPQGQGYFEALELMAPGSEEHSPVAFEFVAQSLRPR